MLDYFDCPQIPSFENCKYCDVFEVCLTYRPTSERLIDRIRFDKMMELDYALLDNLF